VLESIGLKKSDGFFSLFLLVLVLGIALYPILGEYSWSKPLTIVNSYVISG
jgi:hypothetical protein